MTGVRTRVERADREIAGESEDEIGKNSVTKSAVEKNREEDLARTVASWSTAIQLLSRSAVPSALICAGVNARARSSAADTTACAVCEPSCDGGGESTMVLPALLVL
jgi:hypothetical protein